MADSSRRLTVNMQAGAYLGESMKQVILAAVASTALAGCASITLQGYEGLARPDNETAVVRATGWGRRTSKSILFVSVDSPRGDPIPIQARAIRLLPRETCIRIELTSISGLKERELCFEPYAGRSYEVRLIRVPVSYVLDPDELSDVYTLLLRDVASRELLSYVEIPRAGRR